MFINIEDIKKKYSNFKFDLEEIKKFENNIFEAYRIRSVETSLLKAFGEGKLDGTIHTCVGQEFSAVALGRVLSSNDWITSSHRCHGHFIAKTKNWKSLIDELFGKKTGICSGIGSSQHLYDKGFISNGPQGLLAPVGSGIAFNERNKNSIVATILGEGTFGEGVIYEALNVASLLKLPQMFICENNFYSQSTPQDINTSGDIKSRFEAFGIKTFIFNTWEINNLFVGVEKAYKIIKNNSEPIAIIIQTYRLNAHSKGDDDRSADEINYFKNIDPLNIIKRKSIHFAKKFALIDDEIGDYFEESSKKESLDLHSYLGDQLPKNTSDFYKEAKTNYKGRFIEVLNNFLHEFASSNGVIIGEDIADPYGGAFKATKGISKKYPKQVVTTPISEATIVGMTAGIALSGGKVCAEIMFGDFVTNAFDQIINGISKYHHMYGKKISCPAILRMPMGGKRGYGPTHSQSLEKFLCGIDNLLVVSPTSLEDPKLTYKDIFSQKCPSIIIENKIEYTRKSIEINNNLEIKKNNISLGNILIKPKYNKSHFCIVTYGETARLIYDNYNKIVEEINATFVLVNLLKLNPLEISSFIKQISKTQGVLIVEEGSVNFGISAEIAYLLKDNGYFGKIRRLGSFSVPIPSAKNLEEQCLPNIKRICSEIHKLLDA
jgi:2-oxoisovalerate dehydrogenase E1 component